MRPFNKNKYYYKDNNKNKKISKNSNTKTLNPYHSQFNNFYSNGNINFQNKDILSKNLNNTYNINDRTYKIGLNESCLNLDFPTRNPYKTSNNKTNLKNSINTQYNSHQKHLDKNINSTINNDIKNNIYNIDMTHPINSNNNIVFSDNSNKALKQGKFNFNMNKNSIKDSINIIGEDGDDNSSNDSIDTVDLLFKNDNIKVNNKKTIPSENINNNDSFMENIIINEYNNLLKKKKDKLILGNQNINDGDGSKSNYPVFKNTGGILSQRNIKDKNKNLINTHNSNYISLNNNYKSLLPINGEYTVKNDFQNKNRLYQSNNLESYNYNYNYNKYI